jgi:tRNA-specific 2-thiouridylase
VRVGRDPVSGRRTLRRGIDPAKDQSYFLYDLTEEQLAAARFPVGSLTKDEVRAHARRAGLPTADKAESQEICFVPAGTRAGEFVAREAAGLGLSLPSAPGRLEDSSGKTLGTHDGHFRFTIGQRRGIGVAASRRSGTEGATTERLYVLEIDAGENRVVVGRVGEARVAEASLGDLG